VLSGELTNLEGFHFGIPAEDVCLNRWNWWPLRSIYNICLLPPWCDHALRKFSVLSRTTSNCLLDPRVLSGSLLYTSVSDRHHLMTRVCLDGIFALLRWYSSGSLVSHTCYYCCYYHCCVSLLLGVVRCTPANLQILDVDNLTLGRFNLVGTCVFLHLHPHHSNHSSCVCVCVCSVCCMLSALSQTPQLFFFCCVRVLLCVCFFT
jgi:hypothetical protein